MTDDYIGYKHPPKRHRFKPGASGNLGGKRMTAGPLDAAALLSAPVSVSRNGRKVAIDPRQTAFESQFKRALQGDFRAASACLEKCIAAGLLRQWVEDEWCYLLTVPHEWNYEEWQEQYRLHGPPLWLGERDGLVPLERRSKHRSRRP